MGCRVFDALNDVDQLEVGIKAVHKAGGVVEGTICYSGDSKCEAVVHEQVSNPELRTGTRELPLR